MPEQMEFPSVSFGKDRRLLYPFEVAERFSCTVDHIYDLIAEGRLKAINITGSNNLTERRCLRIPIEFYREFLNQNIT